MGHHDEGDSDLLLQVHQLKLGMLSELAVQRAQGFVEKQQLGMLGQAARQRHPLALATGYLIRLAPGKALDLQQREHFGYALTNDLFSRPLLPESEGDVLRHRHVRKQRIGLEHHVDRAVVGRHLCDVDAVDMDPPRRRAFETGKHAQQRRLPAARRTQQREKFAAIDIQ